MHFPMKLYELVDAGPPDIVSWSESGLSFLVSNTEIFCDEILPRHFRHNKLTSFQRQLNLYGFHRISKGIDAGRYRHPLFQRGRLDLLSSIKRETRGESRMQPRESLDPRGFSPAMDNAVSGATSSQPQLSSIPSTLRGDHSPTEANGGDRWNSIHATNRQQLNDRRSPQHSLEGKWNTGNGGGSSSSIDMMMVLQRQTNNGTLNGSSLVSRYGGTANHHGADNQNSCVEGVNEHPLSLSSLSNRSLSSQSDNTPPLDNETSQRTSTSQETVKSDTENAALAILGMSRVEPARLEPAEKSASSPHVYKAGSIRDALSLDPAKNGYRSLDSRNGYASIDLVRDCQSDSTSSGASAVAQLPVVDMNGDMESQLRKSIKRQCSLEREVEVLKNQLETINQTVDVLAQTVVRHLGVDAQELKSVETLGEYRRVKRRPNGISNMPEDCNPNRYDPEHTEQLAWSDYTDASST